MKMNYQLPIAIASIAIATSHIGATPIPVGFIQNPEGRQHNITISLQTASAGESDRPKPNTKGKYSWSQKIETEKISNKQILEALVNENLGMTEIKGWSIVMLTSSSGEIIGTYLKKKGENLININQYFNASDNYSFSVSNGSGKTTDNPKSDVGTFTVTMQFLSNLELNIGIHARVTGVLEASALGSYENEYEELFIKKANFTDLTGLVYRKNDNVDVAYGIVTGNVKAGEGSLYTFVR